MFFCPKGGLSLIHFILFQNVLHREGIFESVIKREGKRLYTRTLFGHYLDFFFFFFLESRKTGLISLMTSLIGRVYLTAVMDVSCIYAGK